MERDDLNEGKTARLKARLIHYMKILIVTALAVVLTIFGWMTFGHGHGRIKDESSAMTVSIEGAKLEDSPDYVKKNNEKKVELKEPTSPDGTGAAGTMEVKDGRLTSSGLSGWQNSKGQKWYEVSKNVCYYGGWQEINGKTYFFDMDGYAATGWKAISPQNGSYFGDDGVYVPNMERSKMIALTFNDGPTEYTEEILDLLRRNDAKATFFLTGEKIEEYASAVEQMVEDGHTIGNLGYTGADFVGKTASQVAADFKKTDEIISEFNFGKYAAVVRFPGGFFSKEAVTETGRSNILWDTDSFDTTQGGNQIVSSIYAQLEGGCIILMHDTNENTIEALERMLKELTDEGYEFVNIEDLAASRGYFLNAGTTFYGFTEREIKEGRVTDK